MVLGQANEADGMSVMLFFFGLWALFMGPVHERREAGDSAAHRRRVGTNRQRNAVPHGAGVLVDFRTVEMAGNSDLGRALRGK